VDKKKKKKKLRGFGPLAKDNEGLNKKFWSQIGMFFKKNTPTLSERKLISMP
jgi:hypothetical protein